MTRCANKVRYRTKKEALAGAAYDRRRGLDPKRPYKCPICRQWHLTSQPRLGPSSGRNYVVEIRTEDGRVIWRQS